MFKCLCGTEQFEFNRKLKWQNSYAWIWVQREETSPLRKTLMLLKKPTIRLHCVFLYVMFSTVVLKVKRTTFLITQLEYTLFFVSLHIILDLSMFILKCSIFFCQRLVISVVFSAVTDFFKPFKLFNSHIFRWLFCCFRGTLSFLVWKPWWVDLEGCGSRESCLPLALCLQAVIKLCDTVT